MADKNVIPIAFDDETTTNFNTLALYKHKVAPKNLNIASGVPSGDVIFELNTPKDTFLDLFKTYMTMDYTLAGAASTRWLPKQPFLSCMFSRAVCYVNGVKIAQSNNYTADGALSRRLQFGKQYNECVNGYYSLPDVANDATDTTPAGNYTTTDTLDSFWLRQTEGLIIPPNSNIRFEFTIDSNYLAKASMKTTAAVAIVGTCAIVQFWMNPTYYVNPSELKSSYRLRFIGLNSFMSTLGAADTTKIMQYTVSPSIVKACLTHLPATYQTVADANRKFETAYMFNAGTTLQTLQFKCGNVVYPQTVYNFAYGMEEAYEDYVNHTQQIAKDTGKEEYEMYRDLKVAPNRNNWGPIFMAPIVKDGSDPTNTLEVNATYTAAGATVYTILTSLEEQRIDVAMSAAQVMTTPLH